MKTLIYLIFSISLSCVTSLQAHEKALFKDGFENGTTSCWGENCSRFVGCRNIKTYWVDGPTLSICELGVNPGDTALLRVKSVCSDGQNKWFESKTHVWTFYEEHLAFCP